ncbi:hypothetical protein [uncultured Methanobrevibacter sp.]|nr:hypothetical protein [uncultured Methanobrevibacter sp.]
MPLSPFSNMVSVRYDDMAAVIVENMTIPIRIRIIVRIFSLYV